MAGEPIGLQGIFELEGFDKGMQAYMSGIQKANTETEKTASNFGKSFSDMGGQVNKMAGTIGTVLVGATAGAGVALGGFAVKGIGQAIEMEKQMSAIAAIMGKTTEEVKPLSQEIIKLGLDPTLMVDATQAADAIQQLAKNGLSMDQILQGAAKSTVLLANATGANFGDAASIATGAMKLFNIDAKDMEGAVSKIVSVTTNSKFTIGDYAQALANGGGAATAAGVTFQDFNATITATSSLFAGGGDAATSFKTFLQRLQPTTKDATDTMIKLGLATKDGKSKFFDAKGEIKSMAEISGMLSKALAGMSDAQKSATLSTLFGADAMRTAVGLANTGKEGFTKLQEQMAKTSAVDQAATKMGNLAGVIEITKGAIDAISLTVGQAFLPMVTDMAKSISQFISDHASDLTDWFQQVAYAIEAFANMDTADINWENIVPGFLVPVMEIVGQGFDYLFEVIKAFQDGVVGFDFPWEDILPPALANAAYFISDAIQFVGDHLEAFKGALIGVGAVLAASSITSMLVGVGAAIAALNLPLIALIAGAALLGAAWNDNWFGIRDATMPILEAIGSALQKVGIVIQSFTSDVPGAYPWEDIFPPWLADTLHTLSFTIQGFQTLMDDFHAGVFGRDYDWQNVFPPGVSQLAQTVSDAIYTTSDAMKAVQEAFAPLTSAIAENGAGALEEIKLFATGNQTEFTNVKAIWDGLTATASNVFNAIAPIVSAALDAFKSAIGPWGEAALSWISTAVTNAPTKLNEWYTALTNAISGHIGEWVSYLIDWSDPLVNWVSTAITNIPAKVNEWYTALSGQVSSWLSVWVDYLLDWSDPLIDWIGTAITNIPGKVTEWYNALTGQVTTWLQPWIDYLLDWSDPLIDWVGTAITNIPGKINEWYTALSTTVSSHIGEWVSYLMDWSEPLISWVSTAINAIPGKINEWYTALSGAASSWLQSWIDTFPEWSDAASDWIATAATTVGTAFADYMTKLLAAVAAGLPTFMAAFYDFEATATKWIGNAALALPIALGLFIQKIIDWGAGEGLQGITTAVAGFAGKALSWIDDDLIPKVGPAMGRFLAELVLGIGKAVIGVGAAAVLIGTALYNALTETDWQQVGTDIINLVIKGVEVTGHLIKSIIDGFTKEMSDQLGIIDWTAAGNAIMTKINQGVQSMVNTVVQTFTGAVNTIQTTFTEIDWEQLGTDIIHFISDAAVAALSYLGTGIDFIVQYVQTTWTSIDWAKIGTDLINAIRDAAVSAAEDLYTKFATMVTTVKEKFTTFDWKEAGTAIIEGIKKGIDSKLEELWTKVNGIVDGIKEKIKNALKWSSPAKVMIPPGAAIVEGLEVGIQKASASLYKTMGAVMQKLIGLGSNPIMHPNFLPSGIGSNWFTNPPTQGLLVLNDYVSAFSDLTGLASDAMSAFDPSLLLPGFEKASAELETQNKQLSLRANLLDLVKSHNLNPSQIFGGKNLADMSPKEISQAIMAGSYQVNRLAQERLRIESQELQRMYELSQVGSLYGDQVQRFADLADKPMNMFQQMRFEQFNQQFTDLTAKMEAARAEYMKTGSSIAYNTLQTLTDQRQRFLYQVEAFQNRITVDQAKNNALSGVFNQQLQMLDQLKALGWDLPSFYGAYFKNVDQLSSEALEKQGLLEDSIATATVSMLQKQVAEKALLSTLDTNWNVSGMAKSFVDMYSDKVMAPLLKNLKDVVLLDDKRNEGLAQYNASLDKLKGIQAKVDQVSFLQDQVNLLDQVQKSGLKIGDVFGGIFSGEMNPLGPWANMNDLMRITTQLQEQYIKNAQDQLTPQAIAIRAQQQQVDEQKKQLDLLNRQLDIIHQGQQAGVNWEGFFSGLTTGLNASEEDILTATSRLYQKLIKQALKELGIASPSKVMRKIGYQTMQGFGLGLGEGWANIGTLMSSVPQGTVSNRSMSLQMGGVNIYNGLDEQLLESRIQRIMERALS